MCPFRIGGSFESEQKLAQLVGHGGRHPLGVVIRVELPQPLMAKPNKLHFRNGHIRASLHDCSMYGYSVHVKGYVVRGKQ